MAVSTRSFGLVFGGLLLAACVTTPSSPTASGDDDSVSANDASSSEAVCDHTHAHHCYARFNRKRTNDVARKKAPSGLAAADLASAYNFNASTTVSATVAVVDAYGYTDLESDLQLYRNANSLPTCTTANGCLKIVGQTGGAPPTQQPPSSDDWTVETALDVDMVSAGCPSCKILVVEATNDQDDGLDIANATAASLGATQISNSWGGTYDATSDNAYDSTDFNHPGIFVAAGDCGYNSDDPSCGGGGVDYPSTSVHVIAVGGTSLTQTTGGRGWTETAWSDGGSSCNTAFTAPSFQNGFVTSATCAGRATTDVSAVADPDTGVLVYNKGSEGVVGGTSAASPLVAAIFALTGHGAQNAALIYANPSAFYDVTSGDNNAGNDTCTQLMCNSAAGWDGPTGLGTPNGSALAAISGDGSGGSGSGGSGSNMGSGSDQGSGDQGSGSNMGSDGDNNGGNGSSGGGGCAATGGTGGAMTMLFAFGLACARRRRRVA